MSAGRLQASISVVNFFLAQHLKDYLDLDMSALNYMMKCYPEEKEVEQMRRSLGRYGLTGQQQVCVADVCKICV